jgi:hypothetical protein
MVMRKLGPLMLIALLFLSTLSVYGTTCFEPTPEQAEYFARQDTYNSLLKGIFLGLILLALGLNIIWPASTTRKWFAAALLSILAFPVGFIFFLAEMLTGGCDFGSLSAWYYLLPLGVLILIWLVQRHWISQDKKTLSITDER